jgi:MFS transporter, PAT family, beta-lactamase induction signal transducer AmpG
METESEHKPVQNLNLKARSAWTWVPSLYFAQGIPYSVVMQVATVFYKLMGVSNQTLAYQTSWLNLPWVLKPLWSPFIELLMTKRRWIAAMQILIAVALSLIALGIPTPSFFTYTLILFWIIAICSATHDIAADGFYLMTMPVRDQATFVGVRSTFFRLALLAGQGLTVLLAGSLERASSLPADQVHVVATYQPGATQPFDATLAPPFANTHSDGIQTSQKEIQFSSRASDPRSASTLREKAHAWNVEHGFVAASETIVTGTTKVGGWVAPLEEWIRKHFAPVRSARVKNEELPNLALVFFRVQTPIETDAPRIVTLRRMSGSRDLKVVEGERVEVRKENQGTPFAVLFEPDARGKHAMEAVFVPQSGNLRRAWSLTFGIISAIFMSLAIYHVRVLPVATTDFVSSPGWRSIALGLKDVIVRFFGKPGIVRILLFLLFYRFAEAQLVKMIQPFLLDARQEGGMALTTSQVGSIYGVCGVAMLLAGGILGGSLAGRDGLRRWYWPMVFAINAPNMVYWLLAWVHPESWGWSAAAVAVESFGYGFGFAAYILISMAVARGGHETAHYAFCTGIWALGLMLPGMASGWLQKLIGYEHFFAWVLIATLPSFFVSFLLPRRLLDAD